MKKFTMSIMVAAMLFIGFGCEKKTTQEDSVEVAEEVNEDRMDEMDTEEKEDQAEFLVKAASGGMMEVELGRMAKDKAKNAEVKKFGEMMVTDHSKANEELKTLAAAKNITLPATVGSDHQEHIDRLSKLTGADFDREYMSLMVDDHQKDIDHFKEAANEDDNDAEVRAFASKTVPVLEKHLQRAKEVNDMVKNMK